MPLDSNIYTRNQGPAVQLNDPLNTAMRAAQYQGQMSENALSGMKQQQAGQEMSVQAELDNFDGQDPSTLSKRAQKMYASSQIEQQKAQLEDHMAKVDAGSQLAGGAYDQASWDAFRGQMSKIAPDMLEGIPAQYSKEVRDGLVNAGIKAKDSMNQALKEIDQQMRMMQIQQTGNNQREMMDFRREQQEDRNTNALSGGNVNMLVEDTDQGKMLVNPRTGEVRPMLDQSGKPLMASKTGSSDEKPMSAGNSSIQREMTSGLGNLTRSQLNADALIEAIDAGKIDFGRGAGVADAVLNNTVSTDNSRNKARLQEYIKELQLTIQSEQKGTQTERDSLSILESILNTPYDKENVKAGLKKISANQAFEAQAKEAQIQDFRSGQNRGQLDVTQYKHTQPTLNLSGMPRPAAPTPQAPTAATKTMTFQQLQQAAQTKFGGDLNAAAAAAQQHGYSINGQ